MHRTDAAITSKLVRWGKDLFDKRFAPIKFTGNQEADRLLNNLENYPHAFVIGCLMDRQIKAERAWLIPYQLSERLGGFDFKRLAGLSENRVSQLMKRPTRLHRFVEMVSKHLHQAIGIVRDQYDQDASRIWKGKPSSAMVVYRFLEFPGIGPKIATMATNILVRRFKTPMSDYYSIDISADVHVRRVFARLGLVDPDCSVESVVYRARALHPAFPGLLDFPCWEIGRNWCKPRAPLCHSCEMMHICPSARGTKHA